MLLLKTIFFGAGSVAVGTAAMIEYKALVPREQRLHVAMDLDQTIVKTFSKRLWDGLSPEMLARANAEIEVTSSEKVYTYKVYTRPYAPLILGFLSRFTNLYLFTYSKKEYADPILEKCFPDVSFVGRFYRDDCERRDDCKRCKDCGQHQKNLEVITPTARAILVDDKKSCHVEGQDLYHIPKYHPSNFGDFEMIKMFYYLLWKA